MSYSVPSDTVPDDGYPYYADWCPTCQEPRPFRIEDDDAHEMTCAVCGLVREYEGMDSPGTSPEPELDDDAATDDAMIVTYGDELWLGTTP